MKLIRTFKNLIVEVAARDEVISAIRNKEVVEIFYAGDEEYSAGYRLIEPVCLGEKQKKNGTVSTLIRAWEIEGASHTATIGEQPLPGWRLFRIDKITTWKRMGENFSQPRPNYNFNGDKTMTRVIINSKF